MQLCCLFEYRSAVSDGGSHRRPKRRSPMRSSHRRHRSRRAPRASGSETDIEAARRRAEDSRGLKKGLRNKRSWTRLLCLLAGVVLGLFLFVLPHGSSIASMVGGLDELLVLSGILDIELEHPGTAKGSVPSKAIDPKTFAPLKKPRSVQEAWTSWNTFKNGEQGLPGALAMLAPANSSQGASLVSDAREKRELRAFQHNLWANGDAEALDQARHFAAAQKFRIAGRKRRRAAIPDCYLPEDLLESAVKSADKTPMHIPEMWRANLQASMAALQVRTDAWGSPGKVRVPLEREAALSTVDPWISGKVKKALAFMEQLTDKNKEQLRARHPVRSSPEREHQRSAGGKAADPFQSAASYLKQYGISQKTADALVPKLIRAGVDFSSDLGKLSKQEEDELAKIVPRTLKATFSDAVANAAAASAESPSGEEAAFSFTLVTQASFDRAGLLQGLCGHWDGPISMAIYLANPDAHQMVPTLENPHVFVRDEIQSACKRQLREGTLKLKFVTADLRIFDTLQAAVNAHWEHRLATQNYPINFVRNVALDAVAEIVPPQAKAAIGGPGKGTTHVFIVDADQMPSLGMHRFLTGALMAAKVDATAVNLQITGAQVLADPTAAFVVPSFETSLVCHTPDGRKVNAEGQLFKALAAATNTDASGKEEEARDNATKQNKSPDQEEANPKHPTTAQGSAPAQGSGAASSSTSTSTSNSNSDSNSNSNSDSNSKSNSLSNSPPGTGRRRLSAASGKEKKVALGEGEGKGKKDEDAGEDLKCAGKGVKCAGSRKFGPSLGCCPEEGLPLSCFRKHETYGQCRVKCPESLDEEDGGGWLCNKEGPYLPHLLIPKKGNATNQAPADDAHGAARSQAEIPQAWDAEAHRCMEGLRGMHIIEFTGLAKCIDEDKCRSFHSLRFPQGHGSTNTSAWLQQGEGTLRRLGCLESEKYEPYVILPYSAPGEDGSRSFRFDDSFSGYGLNKITFVQTLVLR
eukprot:scaffold2739_cov257-Pinguiococcus_pyrenoidosus.AAC.3